MTLNLEMPPVADLRPRITVFGVGGAGCNAVNNMIEKQLGGVEFVVANTDAQALSLSNATNKLQLGEKATEGLGAGAQPAVGARAAEESLDAIIDQLSGAHMCFITAGMGGGTGTGAAPIIAQAARELGILTVGVVTKPFQFEGMKRAKQADDGVDTLGEMVDTLIIIPNQNLFRIANEKTTFTEAFSMADDVLYQGVKGVTDLMVRPGIINLDFADIRVVMNEMGKAMMGTGEADGEDRAIQAAEKAINNPLLDEISLDGARGVLINITGGVDLTLFEVDEAANRIRDRVDPNANILVGSALDETLEGKMRVSVVATGIDAKEGVADVPVPRRTLKAPLPIRADDLLDETHAGPTPTEPQPAPQQPAPAADDASIHYAQSSAESETSTDFQADTVTADAQPDAFEPSLFDVPEFAPRAPYDASDDMPHTADDGYFDQHRATATAPTEPANITAVQGVTDHNGFEPHPEVLQRLQKVVNKVPEMPSNPHQQQATAVNDPAQSVAPPAEKKGMFSNLIGKVTGQTDQQIAPQTYRREPDLTQQDRNAAQNYTADAPRDDADALDVPAFLRRQAN